MKSMFAKLVVKYKTFFAILALILIIPALIGFVATKTNYNILVYLPNDIETLKGQEILAKDFNMGAFSLSVVDDIPAKELLELEDKIREIGCVNEVMTINDLTGTSIPSEILPNELASKLTVGKTKLILEQVTKKHPML